MGSHMNAEELLDAMDEYNANGDTEGAATLIAKYPDSAEALRIRQNDNWLEAARAKDLLGQGWMTVQEAARYVPYSTTTLSYLMRNGKLGEQHVDWERDSNWPYRTYLSPEALSRLHRREYKASGPRGPRRKDAA
jgi:hypothetical protein